MLDCDFGVGKVTACFSHDASTINFNFLQNRCGNFFDGFMGG